MRLPTLHLSLTANGFEAVRTVQWMLVVIVAGAVITSGWLWWDSRMLSGQAAAYETATQRIQNASQHFAQESLQAGFDLSENRLKALSQEVAFSNQLNKQRTFSWTRFLSDLEEAVPARISIGSVMLNGTDHTVTLSGSALTLKDVTVLVNSLEHQPSFRNVVLSQHRLQEPKGTEERKKRPTVEFMLSAAYKPPSPASSPQQGEDKR